MTAVRATRIRQPTIRMLRQVEARGTLLILAILCNCASAPNRGLQKPVLGTAPFSLPPSLPAPIAPPTDPIIFDPPRPCFGLGEFLIIYFDRNSTVLRKDQMPRIQRDLEYLLTHPDCKIVIEGNADERGPVDYNILLGERRANAVKRYLIKNGIAAERLLTISKGAEMPADPGHDEKAWSKNRRCEFFSIR